MSLFKVESCYMNSLLGILFKKIFCHISFVHGQWQWQRGWGATTMAMATVQEQWQHWQGWWASKNKHDGGSNNYCGQRWGWWQRQWEWQAMKRVTAARQWQQWQEWWVSNGDGNKEGSDNGDKGGRCRWGKWQGWQEQWWWRWGGRLRVRGQMNNDDN